jgi:hypothetical protein
MVSFSGKRTEILAGYWGFVIGLPCLGFITVLSMSARSRLSF